MGGLPAWRRASTTEAFPMLAAHMSRSMVSVPARGLLTKVCFCSARCAALALLSMTMCSSMAAGSFPVSCASCRSCSRMPSYLRRCPNTVTTPPIRALRLLSLEGCCCYLSACWQVAIEHQALRLCALYTKAGQGRAVGLTQSAYPHPTAAKSGLWNLDSSRAQSSKVTGSRLCRLQHESRHSVESHLRALFSYKLQPAGTIRPEEQSL